MTSRRYELTNEQWDKIKHYFEVAKKNGRPYKDVRNTVNGIVWILKSGAPWRDLPACYGQWNAVYKFSKWQEQELFEKIFEELIAAQEAVACIKPRRNRRVAIPFDKDQYKERHLVECFFQKLKRYRRIATRYEKLAKRFLAFIHFACILIWLL